MAYFKKYEDAKNYAETCGIAYPYKIVWSDPIFAPKELRAIYIVVFEYDEPEGC